MRFDRINAELASSRERYWRAKQESQEKRDDMNRMIAFASVVLSVVLFEPFRLYFNRRAVRLENTKLVEDTKREIQTIASSIEANSQILLLQMQGQKPELVDNSCQTDNYIMMEDKGDGVYTRGGKVPDKFLSNGDIYKIGLVTAGVGIAAFIALQLGRSR